jgi:hypothetical protein
VVCGGSRAKSRVVTSEAGEAHQPTQEGEVVAEVGWMDVQPPQLVELLSPDGKRVLEVRTTPAASEVFVTDADGRNAIRLSPEGVRAGWPCWSIAVGSSPRSIEWLAAGP